MPRLPSSDSQFQRDWATQFCETKRASLAPHIWEPTPLQRMACIHTKVTKCKQYHLQKRNHNHRRPPPPPPPGGGGGGGRRKKQKLMRGRPGRNFRFFRRSLPPVPPLLICNGSQPLYQHPDQHRQVLMAQERVPNKDFETGARTHPTLANVIHPKKNTNCKQCHLQKRNHNYRRPLPP